MKRFKTGILAAVLLVTMLSSGCGTASQDGESGSAGSTPVVTSRNGNAEWTVMFYLCGSDLESKYGYASGNLQEIATCEGRKSILDAYTEFYGNVENFDSSAQPGKVNVLIETGGSRAWRARGDMNMDISSDQLQRWYFDETSERTYDENEGSRFILQEELPSASMADSETLADFIRWSAETYPAEKYALVLWDHGMGARGIFIDELYDQDTMAINELHDALEQSGVELELLVFDACMMANLETASAARDYAKWMCSSEELVAGKGTAVGDWLQQLYVTPECDGERLGRWICDMTMEKYANEDDEQSQQLMTWSVINLSKMERVEKAFDQFFQEVGYIYETYPGLMTLYAKQIIQSEDFGTGKDNLWALTGIFYDPIMSSAIPLDTEREMLDAMSDAITYSIRGMGRSSARGLSFCYATDFDIEELEAYSKVCPSPHYLALLDAISPWTAPDWVYETAEHLPEMDTIDEYKVTIEKHIQENGTPSFSFAQNGLIGVGDVAYETLYQNEDTGMMIRLGVLPTEDEMGEFVVDNPVWPSIDGVLCNAETLTRGMAEDPSFLFNIPIQIGTDIWFLRCGYEANIDDYVLYGLWEGYESDSSLFNRNVKPLAELAGQEYRLLYPIEGAVNDKTRYESSEKLTMYRSLVVDDIPLPPGTYYIKFIVYDLFMRPMELEPIEIYWDGESLTYAENINWEGTEELSVSRDYWN